MKESWFFDASGGCEMCGAKSGEYPFPPGRPHPNCNCKINRIIEECTLQERQRFETPGETFEVSGGPGSRPNSEIIHVYQEVLVVVYEVWECVYPGVGSRQVKEHTYDFLEAQLVRSFERILV